MKEVSLRTKLMRWTTACVAVAVIGAGLGWSAKTVLSPAPDVLAGTPFTYVNVVEGEVGSSINLNTVAEWTPLPAGSNQAIGTVTTVDVEVGAEVSAGTTLYTVDLRPVVIATGAIPAFRVLSEGATGADVQQLQGLLRALDFYTGAQDGGFGAQTTSAVKRWQKSLGVAEDGVVQPGDIIFVSALPTRIVLDAEVVKRGAPLQGGEPILTALPAAPTFKISVTDTQAFLMPAGTRVEVTGPLQEVWTGYVVDQEVDAQSGIFVILAGQDGALICADACGTIPAVGEVLLSSRIVTVESVSGLTVPSAALRSNTDASVSVIDDTGTEYAVLVITSARGMSIVDGVPAGTAVRIPATKR